MHLRKRLLSIAGLLIGLPIFVIAVADDDAPPGVTPPNSPGLGQPLSGLSSSDVTLFNSGRNEFTKAEQKADGLGPVFNGVSCVQCHSSGATGGAGPNLNIARVTRIGAMQGPNYSDLAEFGGPVIQARSLREFDPQYPVPREVVPPQAQFVSLRITTPLFGDGLIEAIPDETILVRARGPQGDGVQGHANMEINPQTGVNEVGRFGWKSQHARLRTFAGDAFLNEMGITNVLFPTENLPQGMQIPPGADVVPDPEDEADDIDGLTNFMRFLAPPPTHTGPVTFVVARGEKLFNTIRCAACHTPAMQTGPNPNPALSNKAVALYSDLLLHRMGQGLADGIRQGMALGDDWRTAPLWGLSARHFYLHDGRANNLDQAIRQHGGEAQTITNRYVQLSQSDRNAIIAFLGQL